MVTLLQSATGISLETLCLLHCHYFSWSKIRYFELENVYFGFCYEGKQMVQL